MDTNKILSDYEKFILIIEITNRLNSILPGFDINYDISYLDNIISINIYKYTDYNNENAKIYTIDLSKEVDNSKISKDLYDAIISVSRN